MDDQQPATCTVPAIPAAMAETLIERAAQITAVGMPLSAGLRAAAQESDSSKLAAALRQIAAEVDRGRSLHECLVVGDRRWPQPLAGLLEAAERVGEAGPMLTEWIENRQSARRHWRGVLAALAYPAFSIVLFILVFVEFSTIVIRPFEALIEDFGMRIPMNTRAIFWLSNVGIGLLGWLALLAAAGLVAVRVFGGRAAWSWLMSSIPLVGAAWHWSGVAEMLRCLSLLVEYRLPLPEALRLTAGGVSDAYVARQCRLLADRTEQGTSLAMSLVHLRTLPLSIVPLIRWGERGDCLAEALRSAASMLEGRLRLRTSLLVQVVPPVVFVMIGVMVLALVGMIGGTLIPLIRTLS